MRYPKPWGESRVVVIVVTKPKDEAAQRGLHIGQMEPDHRGHALLGAGDCLSLARGFAEAWVALSDIEG